MRHRLIGGVLAAAATALIAGCSDAGAPAPGAAPSSPPVSSAAPAATTVAAEHNAADVAFVQGMLPHHTQAITMSAQAPDRAASREVKDLATEIEQAQAPEIARMNQMLAAWGVPAPRPGSTAMPDMPGMAMGGMSMPGMMNEGQMQQLATLSGPAFDRSFLPMMIEHHTGAVQMAQTELAQGQNPQAKQLAQAVIADQQAEVARMRALLGAG